MAHEHKIKDSDLQFVIDPATREIQNISGKSVIVQYDHKSECLSFELPRMVKNHDMSACDKVEVLCINKDTKNQEEVFKSYKVLDLKVDPEDENKVIFSCTLTDEVMQYVGTLDFSIRFSCLSDFVMNNINLLFLFIVKRIKPFV